MAAMRLERAAAGDERNPREDIAHMAELQNRWGSQAQTRTDAHLYDEGLRAYMLRVYNYMAAGVALTGLVALGVYLMSVAPDAASAYMINGRPVAVKGQFFLTQFGYTMFVSPLKWVVMLAPLAIVFLLSFRVDRMSAPAAQMWFWLYAALVGASLAVVLLVYTHTSVARVFFITAAAFAGLSLWGYTTKKDISGWGSFLIMGLIGIIIAALVNIFLQSSALQFAVSVIGVLVFSGLTAYDTQRIKESYSASYDGSTLTKGAVMGALTLYLDFINLFTSLLSLFGNRE
jgi:hypothetical protein